MMTIAMAVLTLLCGAYSVIGGIALIVVGAALLPVALWRRARK